MAELDAREGAAGTQAEPQPKHANRRDSTRRLPRSLLTVECRVGLQGLGPSVVDHALDISETGMAFASRAALDCGAKVQVSLFARGHSGPVKVIGAVVRCHPVESGLFDIALQFEHRLKYADYQLLT